MSEVLTRIKELSPYLTIEERQEIDKLIMDGSAPVWMPWPDSPQKKAMESEADILFYGGAAGGGKSELLLGLSLTEHVNSIIFRREGTQHKGIIRRYAEILGSKDGFNGQDRVWRWDNKTIDLGSCPNLGDEEKHQGIPHDLVGFDEITHFLESQFRFLIGWNRTTIPNQRCRIVCTGNPPVDSDGEWVISFWAPWLDEDHPNPAEPGELRWFVTKEGKDVEVDGPAIIEVDGEMVQPLSRTFIPSRVTDNPALMETGYISTLQALPEPLRSQMLHGDFLAGLGSDPWQVIPTEWVKSSQKRWTPDGRYQHPMDSLGADIARDGLNQTVLSRRHGLWFDEMLKYPGSDTPNGPMAAALIVASIRDKAPAHVDVIGVGSSVVDHLDLVGSHVVPIDSRKKTLERDRGNNFGFANFRSQLWWRMREALDPNHGQQIILPPDSDLKRDLCAVRFKPTVRGIQVESKEDTIDRIGRSPDVGDAAIYALVETEKRVQDHMMFGQKSFEVLDGVAGY